MISDVKSYKEASIKAYLLLQGLNQVHRYAVSVLFLSFTEVYSLTMIVKDDVHIYADISTTHKSEVSEKAIHIDPLTTGYSMDPNKRMG